MSPLRFGALTFATQPYDALVRHFHSFEDLGFDSAWVPDDINIPGWCDFEAWSVLGPLARETRSIRVGTLVTTITYRHPSLLAAQAIIVDHISGGRLELGIGSGGENDYAKVGLDDWTPKERIDRLEEYIALLEPLLRGDPVTYDGQYYQAVVSEMPTPLQRPRPPLIIAAHGDRGLRLTARYADGWNSFGGQPYPLAQDPANRRPFVEAVAETRRLIERLDAFCREIGRDPSTIRRSIATYWPAFDPLASLDAFDEYVSSYRDIGIDEIIFYWPPLDNLARAEPLSSEQHAMFERIATERMPTYRDGASDGVG